MNSDRITESGYFEILDQLVHREIQLIDLRAPIEFTRGAMPFAVNLPLFTDDERALVGTTYRQENARAAVALGIEVFASKSHQFVDEILAKVNPRGEIALHCARGGMRSRSVALYLATMGIKVRLLKGGYKDFRQQVQDKIGELSRHTKLVLIGRTGSGKTELIQLLADAATIDFEGIANHRGSALGAIQQKESLATQQNFENMIAVRYQKICGNKVILVEHESNLGPVVVPESLRRSLNSSPMVLIERNTSDRIKHLVQVYTSQWNEVEDGKFLAGMNLFKNQISDGDKATILELAQKRDFSGVTELLLRVRYDPVYDKSLKRFENNVIKTLNLSDDPQQALNWLRQQLGADTAGG
jgi:tRNA 2-selenouridine synthase